MGVPSTAWPERPTRCRKAGDRARRAELADQIDVADVDAELERGGGDQRLQLAVLQPLLGIEPLLLGEAAVMRGDVGLAQQLGQLARHPLGHAPRVDEDQRGAVLLDQLRQAAIDLLPDLGRHHRFERRVGNLEREIARARDGRSRRWRSRDASPRAGADQEARDLLDRLLRRRQADAQQADRRRARASRSSDSARWLPRLFGRDGVDLVDDHGARGRQHLAAGLRAEQDVERFRRRDDDVRRPAAHALAFARRRVAGAHPGADRRRRAVRARRSSSRMPASGASRLRWMSLESAFSGET